MSPQFEKTNWGTNLSGKRVELSQDSMTEMGNILSSKIDDPTMREELGLQDVAAAMMVPVGTPVEVGGELTISLAQAAEETRAALAQSLGAKPKTGGGYKLDTGKARWDLAPFDAFEAMVKVQTWAVDKKARGDKAYPERNWERGMNWSRVFGAMIRHAWRWWMSKMTGGCNLDDESGLPHSWHFFTCAGFLVAYELRQMDSFDDRPEEIAEKRDPSK